MARKIAVELDTADLTFLVGILNACARVEPFKGTVSGEKCARVAEEIIDGVAGRLERAELEALDEDELVRLMFQPADPRDVRPA